MYRYIITRYVLSIVQEQARNTYVAVTLQTPIRENERVSCHSRISSAPSDSSEGESHIPARGSR